MNYNNIDNIKKACAVVSAILILCAVLSSCGYSAPVSNRVTVACLDFVSYDLARAVCGARAEAKMVIPSDADSHSHELTLSESVSLMTADIVIYGGGENDEAVERAVNASGKDIKVIRLIDCVDLLCADDEEDEGEHEHEHHHEHEYDIHVWTSPANCAVICDAICDKLCGIDGDGKDEYIKNRDEYKSSLLKLDGDLESFFAGCKQKSLIVADVFPFRYFAERYGLEYVAAFGGCAEGDVAPSLTKLAELKNALIQSGCDAVFYTEFSSQLTANCVAEETACRTYMLRSCHRVERDMFASGITYIDLMYQNLNTLKEAFG